mgnify:CR=1 FL=1
MSHRPMSHRRISNRRDFLTQAGSGFGALALATMMHQEPLAADAVGNKGSGGAVQVLHYPPRA